MPQDSYMYKQLGGTSSASIGGGSDGSSLICLQHMPTTATHHWQSHADRQAAAAVGRSSQPVLAWTHSLTMCLLSTSFSWLLCPHTPLLQNSLSCGPIRTNGFLSLGRWMKTKGERAISIRLSRPPSSLLLENTRYQSMATTAPRPVLPPVAALLWKGIGRFRKKKLRHRTSRYRCTEATGRMQQWDQRQRASGRNRKVVDDATALCRLIRMPSFARTTTDQSNDKLPKWSGWLEP